MIDVARGLVIREPWIDLILSGQKMWEMRSQAPAWRGWFGLIRKGSCQISGIARLADVGRALTQSRMIETIDRHRIPEAMIRSGEVEKWTTPWILADVQILAQPVRYRHPNAAITLFTLDLETSEAIAEQLDGHTTSAASAGEKLTPSAPTIRPAVMTTPSAIPTAPITPVARPSSIARILLGEIEITAGNLKNHHFYLRSFLDRFPKELIGGRDRPNAVVARLETDDAGFATTTDICPTHRVFRDRSWTRSFFERSGAAAGDRVVVRELEPFHYQVSLRRRGVAGIIVYEV